MVLKVSHKDDVDEVDKRTDVNSGDTPDPEEEYDGGYSDENDDDEHNPSFDILEDKS